MGRRWTMRITALEGCWSYLASVDDETGIWHVDRETYVHRDNGMTAEEVEEALCASELYDDLMPGGFGSESRHAMFAQN